MKIAILSDIHSNLEALQACCRKTRAQGVEKYICLGDIVGYGPDPVATMDIIMSLPGILAVRGNHDEAALTGTYPSVNKYIQEAISWTHAQLSPNHLNFINELPYVRTLNGAVFAHATVHKPERWEYVYFLEQVKKCMEVTEYPLIFLGHTHFPKLYYETSRGVVRETHLKEGSAIPFYQQRRYLTNVGSVGQPRDGNSAASFVIYDTTAADVTFYRVAYDYTRTAEKILAANLAPRFAKRLSGSEREP